ncbi:N-terminal nucleophile aminohydrolase [Acaromyces ingoldii]|uniref:Proteasome subunit alpha type n=1 Tax=Acaromyces ingoldii TaxID=215250 RepID=A0A316Z249_9BASI|nr:N-terminal nucleophile aminohydrolase [Acaromyces ingoldii]PWN94253.1 N-terminal nucleophile aminohydrolase [Acaromyces ingoldii]
MASQGTGYDLSSSTYSPDGRIFQIEYAQKATENAGTVIGLKCSDGILLAVEKLVQTKLLVPGSNKRIFTIDHHAGVASAGLIADGKHLAGRARSEALNFRDTYRYPTPIKALSDRLALYVQAYTLYSSVRPFGIASIIGGVDADGPQLYMLEPSGVYWGYNGCAIGKGRQLAKTEIEKLSLGKDGMKVADAVQHAANIIYKCHDDAKDKDFELEISWICPESGGKHQTVPAEIVAEAGRKAKEALDDEMED